MRPFCPILLVGVCSLAISCSRSKTTAEDIIAEEELLKPQNETSASLKKCPVGHTTLKDVEIVYGLPPWKGDEAKRFQESVGRLEIWPAGCVSSPDSPKVRPTCTTCRFGFDSQFRQWSRDSTEPRSFKRQFSTLLLSFPTPTTNFAKDNVNYSQSMRSNKVVSQSISYTSLQPREMLVQRINQWVGANGLNTTYNEKPFESDLTGEQKIIGEWHAGRVSVMMQFQKKDSTSWVLFFEFAR